MHILYKKVSLSHSVSHFSVYNIETRKSRLDKCVIILPVKTKSGNISPQLKRELKDHKLKPGLDTVNKLIISTSKNGWHNSDLFKSQIPVWFNSRSVNDILLLELDRWSGFLDEEAHLLLLEKNIFPNNLKGNYTQIIQYLDSFFQNKVKNKMAEKQLLWTKKLPRSVTYAEFFFLALKILDMFFLTLFCCAKLEKILLMHQEDSENQKHQAKDFNVKC